MSEGRLVDQGGRWRELTAVATLELAKAEFEASWRQWLEWAKLREEA
jgi:hypothetical protein